MTTVATNLFASKVRADARAASRGWQDLIVDNFAGGGGASLGIERGAGRAVDVSINHDPGAVEMHRMNHPASWHVCESVWKFDPVADLVKHFGPQRFTFDAAGQITAGVGLAWFSPDCRHFSRAKGGKPVSKRVRGLAWVVVKWAKLVRPTVILLENVREFEQWGPLVQAVAADGSKLADAAGRPVLMPCRDRRGQTFRRWVAQLRRLGYVVEWRLLDAADYGAPTHRRRLFLVARRDGWPIVWPETTHGPKNDQTSTKTVARAVEGRELLDGILPSLPTARLAGATDAKSAPSRPKPNTDHGVRPVGLKPFHTAAECIDWSIPCYSIFTRTLDLLTKRCRQKPCRGRYRNHPGDRVRCPRCGHVSPRVVERPLADKTLRRIAMGFKRYVLDNPRPYIVKVNHGGEDDRSRPVDQPHTTVASRHGDALVTPTLVRVAHGDTSANGRPRGGRTDYQVTEPLPTVAGSKDFAVVAAHLTKFRFDSDGAAVDQPMPTVTAGGDAGGRPAGAAHAMGVTTATLVGVWGRAGQSPPTGVDAPLGTTTSKGDRAVVAATLVQTGYGEAPGQSPRCLDVQQPLGTVVGGGQKHAVVSAFLSEVGNTNGHGDYVRPADAPNATQTSKAKDLLVTAFLAKHYGGDRGNCAGRASGADSPIGTVTTSDHNALVAAHVTRMNHGEKQWSAVDEPLGTVTSQGNKFGLVYAFLTKFFGTAVGQELPDPLHTVTSKDRFGVITVQVDGVTYAIADIGMRMLTPRELARAQGFPDSYLLTGSKANQVHKIGNSVCPVMAEVMVRANCPALQAQPVRRNRRSA